MFADITEDAARAKGYIKGKRKKEEVFSLLKRTTDPTTVYKKQKMDRDDVLDMAGFDVIVWIKGEMRLMLDEEIARAIVYGDGRLPSDEDKIDETHIRPIVKDDSLFVITKDMAGADPINAAKTFDDDHVRAMKEYEGSGNPVMLIQQSLYTELILRKDAHGYRLYKTDAELATALQVDRLIKIPDVIAGDVYSVTINFTDYNVGADKGADIGMFEDFDIDFNQMKYLIETRISGALTKPYSAVVIKRGTAQQSGGSGAEG
jgi:HK97 family phage major capsid protein